LATAGPVTGVSTRPLYLDVALEGAAVLEEPMEPSHNAFVYVFEGEVDIHAEGEGGAVAVGAGTLAVLGDGEGVHIVGRDARNRFLLIAGKPLKEPVARSGPFVMNTREEVMQAFQDYREGRF
jgi:hypothetical protein